jgi:hypothetical protein
MGQDVDEITLINENQTRKRYIDPVLEKIGWHKKYIKEEVNSVKSDFNNNNFIFFNGNIEKGIDRFIDYILLAEDYSVLAIIESKRFSIDEEKGRIQARTYSKDIDKQVDRKIPIFLTNGNVWRFIDEEGIERKVSGPFTQEDLKRRNDLHGRKIDPRNVKIDSRIVDRPRSYQIVTELSEHFEKGHRRALVQMATGTGKTRVAMAIIKLLIDANIIRNVLFIADRIALVNQAKANGFKQYFTEPVADLREGFSTTGRLYVSTVQTLMGGNPLRLFERFSPSFFDLIVFDEAHRSIYDKNNLINEYFDAIKIGLTATPRERELKNTYDLFDCANGEPTVEYSYDDAVRDKVLVPYKANIIETKVLSSGIRGAELDGHLKDQLRRQEEDPDAVEFTGSQFDKVFMDDKTNALIIHEFMELCYKSGEGKPWDFFKFDKVGSLQRGKSKHRPRDAPELLGGPYPLIQTGEVANSGGYIREYYQTYSEIGLNQSKIWPTGTLCITIAANIAKTGILTFDACFPDSIVGFTPYENVRVEYTQFWLSFLQKILEKTAPESAQKNINLKILSNLNIPIPPMELQNKFSDIVERVEQIREYQRVSNKQIDCFFNNLMQQAFKGELAC